jgi:uncharacterized protein (TIGR02453 family)
MLLMQQIKLLYRFYIPKYKLLNLCCYICFQLKKVIMLQPATIKFLQQLGKNNNKPWFDTQREVYEAAKADFEVFVTEVLAGLGELDPHFKGQKAKDCIFRIFRDVRFSKDKTPYKPHFSAAFGRQGKKAHGAGYYIHVQPGGKTFAGGGIWMPEAPALKAVRQEIDYNFKEFTGILQDKKFKKLLGEPEGEKLKTLPQGYAADNPAIEYLKMKSFVVGHNFADTDLGKGFVKQVNEVYKAMQPFINFLNRATEG